MDPTITINAPTFSPCSSHQSLNSVLVSGFFLLLFFLCFGKSDNIIPETIIFLFLQPKDEDLIRSNRCGCAFCILKNRGQISKICPKIKTCEQNEAMNQKANACIYIFHKEDILERGKGGREAKTIIHV